MGLQVHPMEPFIFNASKCYQEEPEEASAFRIDDLKGAFLTLLLGLLTAVLGFVVELAHGVVSQRKMRSAQ